MLRADPASIEAAVGAALAAWPEGSLERLRALVESHPRSGVARLHLGLALDAAGDREREPSRSGERPKRAIPTAPRRSRSESLLHPNMAPGRPFFITPAQPPASLQELGTAAQEAALRRRAERGGPMDWLVLGTFLQRIERPISARRAYDRALEFAPESLAGSDGGGGCPLRQGRSRGRLLTPRAPRARPHALIAAYGSTSGSCYFGYKPWTKQRNSSSWQRRETASFTLVRLKIFSPACSKI